MRPPEHWHLHRRPTRRRWRRPVALGGLAILVLAVAVWFWPSGSSTTTSSDTTTNAPPAAEASSGGCAGGANCVQAPPAKDFSVGPVAAPLIGGRGAVVIDGACDATLYSHNPDLHLGPASLTKIATALVAAEHGNLSEVIDIKVNSALLAQSTGSSVMGLEPGMRLSMRDLLYGLLLPSGNDAAVAIAQQVAVTVPAFVSLMNAKAQAMGLVNTHFANPHGLDDVNHYTSAHDIAELGRALLANWELAAIVRAKNYQPAWSGPQVWNGNELLATYPGTIGVKIGYTERANQTIVAAAQRGGRTLIVSVLASPNRYGDATALLDWAFAHTTTACAAAMIR
jgi:serine-type D-Ala-D-Ala carboxypeptidase (penicillin-binding protein 5/6)